MLHSLAAACTALFALFASVAIALPLQDKAPVETAATHNQRDTSLDAVMDKAAELPQLNAMIVGRDGDILAERVYDGPGLDTPVNIKSASKSLISALAGIAIERGDIDSVDTALADILTVPVSADEQVDTITIEDLLTMRAGLSSTSGRNYGAWVVSDNWVTHALTRDMEAEPGGPMIYSTGTSHLLSAALTQATGRSTLALFRDWLGEPLGISFPPWTRDPQGIYMGGNNMALSPRALFRLGELYRQDGMWDGERVLPAGWVEASWTPRVTSPWSGGSYGYGWWIARAGGHDVYYAWGYGGQMVYVVPGLSLTVVMTSDPNARSVDGHIQSLHSLVARELIPAVAAGM
ncbi:serine hydrolase domain-containing protein [Aquisalinus flavus]|uniref:Serine hydrolase n=1 Tax=Aquisalinus flavus TaxID=1526572 RepID=A0A8J2V2J4_9PROT|nr:serine hydrolase [Aquisalinus flavus]MBD0426103.1 serine hydrolase [Aquisalinus flavus]UNE48312.1 serine hydrolase [Aquisalinus flavus]GGD10607.1 serine hydrolase [Aquisalinus flavus]